jgi:hypothetical protein
MSWLAIPNPRRPAADKDIVNPLFLLNSTVSQRLRCPDDDWGWVNINEINYLRIAPRRPIRPSYGGGRNRGGLTDGARWAPHYSIKPDLIPTTEFVCAPIWNRTSPLPIYTIEHEVGV